MDYLTKDLNNPNMYCLPVFSYSSCNNWNYNSSLENDIGISVDEELGYCIQQGQGGTNICEE